MSRKIKVAEFHGDPILVLEFPDGETWTVRQPLEADYYRYQDVLKEHQDRVLAKGREIAERAQELAQAGQPGGEGAKEARLLIEEEADEARLDVELTNRYLNASLVAIFISPVQKPERVLEMLGPDIINELHAELQQIWTGEAAKKRVKTSDPS